MTTLAIAIAGGLGAVTRFVTDAVIARHNPLRIPLGTLVINVSGSFVLGPLVGLWALEEPGSAGATLTSVLGTGFCGGYTTFSSASVEAMRLWKAEGRSTGIWYAAATLVASVAAAALGLGLGHLMT